MMIAHFLATNSEIFSGSTILTVVGLFIGACGVSWAAITTWLTVKRKNSGKIDTSEAATLWQASESMRRDMVHQLDQKDIQIAKVEEQRDRVINMFQDQFLPALAAINANQEKLTGSVTEVIAVLKATGPLPNDKEP
jgi:hypothetical protein